MLQKLLWQEIRSQARLLAGIFAASVLACFAIILQAYGIATVIQGAFLAERSVTDLRFYFALLIAAAAVKSAANWTAEDLGGRLAAANPPGPDLGSALCAAGDTRRLQRSRLQRGLQAA